MCVGIRGRGPRASAPPAAGIGDVGSITCSLDLSSVAPPLTPYAAGLGVMQAPAQPVSAEAIPADVTGRVLRLLREDYDHVVIDTPLRVSTTMSLGA